MLASCLTSYRFYTDPAFSGISESTLHHLSRTLSGSSCWASRAAPAPGRLGPQNWPNRHRRHRRHPFLDSVDRSQRQVSTYNIYELSNHGVECIHLLRSSFQGSWSRYALRLAELLLSKQGQERRPPRSNSLQHQADPELDLEMGFPFVPT